MNRRKCLEGLGLVGLAGLAGCPAKENPPLKGSALPPVKRTFFNIIFHGIFVYWVDDSGVTVHIPDSSGMHKYKIGWKGLATDYEIGKSNDYKKPDAWPITADDQLAPSISSDEHVVLSQSKLKEGPVSPNPGKVHAAFRLSHPTSVFAFRYSIGPGKVFSQVPDGVRPPSRLGFPVIFSYANPTATTLKFVDSAVVTQEIKTATVNNLHVKAQGEPGQMSDHISVNNNALWQKGKPLAKEFKYEKIAMMQATSASNIGELIGIGLDELLEPGEVEKNGVVIKSNPPDGCLGMWVVE